MKISIANGDIELSKEEKANIESRLRLSLGRFSSRIARVTVEVSAIDTPHVGHKKCRMELFLHPARKIVVEDSDPEIQSAIDRSAAQMARSVERKLKRERELDGNI